MLIPSLRHGGYYFRLFRTMYQPAQTKDEKTIAAAPASPDVTASSVERPLICALANPTPKNRIDIRVSAAMTFLNLNESSPLLEARLSDMALGSRRAERRRRYERVMKGNQMPRHPGASRLGL